MRFLVFLFFLSAEAFGLSPLYLKLKVYGVWISQSANCTAPVPIFYSTTPIYTDFMGMPSLGSLDNSDGAYNGTYRCIMIQMSETIKYVPSTNLGYCSSGTEYSARICSSGQTTIHPETGESGSCQDGTIMDDTVILYMSVSSSATTLAESAGPFRPPTNAQPNYGLQLGSPLVISGAQATKFVVNAIDKVESSGTTCIINTPTFSFSGFSN